MCYFLKNHVPQLTLKHRNILSPFTISLFGRKSLMFLCILGFLTVNDMYGVILLENEYQLTCETSIVPRSF